MRLPKGVKTHTQRNAALENNEVPEPTRLCPHRHWDEGTHSHTRLSGEQADLKPDPYVLEFVQQVLSLTEPYPQPLFHNFIWCLGTGHEGLLIKPMTLHRVFGRNDAQQS